MHLQVLIIIVLVVAGGNTKDLDILEWKIKQVGTL